MKQITILTGSELRHTFFRKWMALSGEIEVLQPLRRISFIYRRYDCNFFPFGASRMTLDPN
jgi:hypothetical protein